MDLEKLIEKLNKINDKTKENIEKSKKDAKDIIDNAKKCYLVATDSANAIVGSKVSCMSVVCVLLNQMLKNNVITNKDLDVIVELAKQSDKELNLGAKKAENEMDKLSKVIDAIMED